MSTNIKITNEPESSSIIRWGLETLLKRAYLDSVSRISEIHSSRLSLTRGLTAFISRTS